MTGLPGRRSSSASPADVNDATGGGPGCPTVQSAATPRRVARTSVDRSLAEHARRGDHAAFSALVEELTDRLHGVATLIVRDPDRAQDDVVHNRFAAPAASWSRCRRHAVNEHESGVAGIVRYLRPEQRATESLRTPSS